MIMKITNLQQTFDVNTFGPILKIELELQIEPIQDADRLLGPDAIATEIGKAFLEQLKTKMSNG